ncbi:MAG: NAD(P)-dependent oxidoreductase [Nitrospira sp.]|nr:NAD(P)-dependent oxidoreductase [Nitrospira sp.]
MNDLKGRRIVLIGGAGFIGHNLALSLKEEGAIVHIIDSLQVNNLLWIASSDSDLPERDLYLRVINQRLDMIRQAGISLLTQDARDYQAMWRLLDQIQPEVVVHLAAVSHASRSNKDPYSTFDHSLRTLENALDSVKNSKAHFIFLSSSMVYGHFLSEEIDEGHPLEPIGIYGALKVAGEKIVIAYQQVFGLPYTIIRPSALYGPRCISRRVGQLFLESALSGCELQVDGDGSERLDFTYVDDLVEGIKLVIRNPASRSQIFNMTYGQSRSINDLVSIVRRHFPGVPVKYVERDRLMPFRGTLSVKKAKDLLGYAPSNPVETGFPKYIQWYRDLDPSGKLWMDIKVSG